MSQATLPNEIPLGGSPEELLPVKRVWWAIRARWGAIPIVLAFIFANLVVSPLFDSPMVDDWSYALTVKRLVEDHQLVQLGWTAVPLISQTIWGALFSLPFGFSFGALHLSTAFLSLSGLLALYWLGRELGIGEGKSCLLALTLLVNPLYLGLTYSFMTDVFSTALSLIALWLYVVAARRGALRWWLLGSLACAAALLSRQTGVFVGLGVAMWLLWQGPRTTGNWMKAGAAAAVPLLAALGFSLWLRIGGTPEGYAYNVAQLAKLPPDIAARNVLLLIPVSLFYLGLFSLPFLTSMVDNVGRFLTRGAVMATGVGLALTTTLAILLFLWFGWPMPFLRFGSMLTTAGVGPNNLLGARPLVLRDSEQWVLTALAGAGATALISIGLLRVLGTGGRPLRAQRAPALQEREAMKPADALSRDEETETALALPEKLRPKALAETRPSPLGPIGFVTAAQAAWVLSGHLYLWDWVFFDRYFLPILPPLLLLLAAATAKLRLSWLAAMPVLVLFGLFSLIGTHDWIAFREAAWSAAEGLVAQGVSLRSVDAGFEWDGWQLYEYSQAHPEEWHHADASPFWIGRRVTPVITSEYVISFSPLDGYSVVRTVPYSNWLAGGQRLLYVLRQQNP